MTAAEIAWSSHFVTSATSLRDIALCPHNNSDGVPLLRWIEVISGQCVYGTLGGVSWSFGRLIRDHADCRILIDLVMAMRTTSSNHFKLQQQFRGRTVTSIPPELVYGSHPAIQLTSGRYYKLARVHFDSSTT